MKNKYLPLAAVIVTATVLLLPELSLAADENTANVDVFSKGLKQLTKVIKEDARPFIDAFLLAAGGIAGGSRGGMWQAIGGAGISVGIFELLISIV